MKQSLAIIFCLLMLKNAFAFAPMLLSIGGGSCCSTEVSISCSDTSSDNQESSDDHCGDDCHCVCCHTFYTMSKLEADLKFHEVTAHRGFEYNNSYSHRFTHGVWQPPRLV